MENIRALLLLVQLLIFIVFCNRYIIGKFLLKLKERKNYPKNDTHEPLITIVTPMYNEGNNIVNAINSFSQINYPVEKMEIVIVDDCSTDDSFTIAKKSARKCKNIRVIRNKENIGKRKSINNIVRSSKAEFIVSVDSDVIVDKDAIRNLINKFTHSKIAAVGGKVNVINKDANWLTEMQTVKYYYGYEFLKDIENTFSCVMCLSGCLTAYRKSVLLELNEIIEKRNLFGIPIKYGEDRFLTRQIVKAGYRTVLTLDAECYTNVPETLNKYFLQQLRWRRSNLVDYLCGISHIWKIHPVVSIHYLGLFSMLITYPLLLYQSFISDCFFDLTLYHISLLLFFVILYKIRMRKIPRKKKVGGLKFIYMCIVMPVTYLIITPLAFFTLDSGSWETRKKQGHYK